MKRLMMIIFLLAACSCSVKAQVSGTTEMPEPGTPWNTSELLAPADLNAAIKTGKAPVILNIGAVGDIVGARHIGPVSDSVNIEKLKSLIAKLPKYDPVIIYCGCCPFSKCPNIKPAYQLLKHSGFTHIEVLNLPVNLQTNWVSKGYPVQH